MSIRLMTDVWERSRAKGSALLLLLAIADNANDQDVAWPSRETLAQKVRMDPQSVRRLVRELEALGELEVDRSGNVAHKTSRYRVIVPPAIGLQVVARSNPPAAGTGYAGVAAGATASSPQGLQPRSPEPSGEPPEKPPGVAPKAPASAAAVDTNVPVAYEPTPAQAQAMAAWGWSPERVALTVESYLGYWRGKPPAKRPRDWQRGFTNWIRRESPDAGDRRSGGVDALAKRDGMAAAVAGAYRPAAGGRPLGTPNPKPEGVDYDHDTWRTLLQVAGVYAAAQYKAGRMAPEEARRLIGAGDGGGGIDG